ncbi:restriction endonuclease [Natronoglycomyces albus]|uniref:Restriction endonuclease n=1 Tax=Natronoglycomyces albus TaxID=2811108 RepID=A0A895XPH5_9ACTN|nr:restriction endonuclease [Natronoglycomyces albus]QSB04426.1 restriction endonuclease [Natronoglycomyces albus]
MSIVIRLGVVIGVLVGLYFAVGWVAANWIWFASAAAVVASTLLAAWVLLRRPSETPDRAVLAAREEIMHDVDQMSVPVFDEMVTKLLKRCEARKIKKFGHKGSDLGCSFVLTMCDGRRVVVRSKKDDGTMRKRGARHIQALGAETNPRWEADMSVLVTNADLHWLRYAGRNKALASQLNVTLMDRKGLAAWLTTGTPPKALQCEPKAIAATASRR